MSEYELPPSGMLRSPRTVAEWRLCRPGDVIQLMGIELEITEENYGPFMRELSWYIDWYLGDRLGDWLMPNYNPSGATRFGDAVTRAYIANGIYQTLCKYAGHRPGFWERMKIAFRGRTPLE